jgi:pyruvate ferredoxin oxidoreductase gamma subunit
MYRIRFHGRGGQGVKTASRILGSAFFLEGFEVQDAPRYGAERRGAPIFAYVRAAERPVLERGAIRTPDLVVVADASLVQVPAAGVLQGLSSETVLLIASIEDAAVWQTRLNLTGRVVTLAPEEREAATLHFMGATCAGAAARLVGAISRASLEAAIRQELGEMPPAVIESNLERALGAFDGMAEHEGCVEQVRAVPVDRSPRPDWVDLQTETATRSAPVIRGGVTSDRVKTGLWRTQRPVIDFEHCRHCTWVCGTFCPDGAISVGSNHEPIIDYEHCKGCLLCVAVCPTHAIRVEVECAEDSGIAECLEATA